MSLPYLDSTLDFDMSIPVNSIIWSPGFLGNGNGIVTTGPFANWRTPFGPLTRNIGGGSTLFTKPALYRVLSRCRTSEISFPNAEEQYNLELLHGGPHVWIGGQMAGLNSAAHDPVFFLHHAFVDYIWEVFRIRQLRFCRVNPINDYPPSLDLHHVDRAMDSYPAYSNGDGYSGYWTSNWYSYESSPHCSLSRSCGTPYLTCGIRRNRPTCISVGRTTAGAEAMGNGFTALNTANSPTAARARIEANSLNIGPIFAAPPAEPRTQDAQLLLRRRRSARESSNKEKNQTEQFFPKLKFKAPESNGRNLDPTGKTIESGVLERDFVFDPTKIKDSNYLFSQSFPLLPRLDQISNISYSSSGSYEFDTFSLNTQTSGNNLVFVPVRIKHNTTSLETNTNSSVLPDSHLCTQHDSDASLVKVRSEGLSYDGSYTDFAFVNASLQSDITTAYVVLKSPHTETIQAMILGVYGCGRMCQAQCRVPHVMPPEFEPCTGVITLSAKDSDLYVFSYEQAIAKAKKMSKEAQNDFSVILQCAPLNDSPWFVKR